MKSKKKQKSKNKGKLKLGIKNPIKVKKEKKIIYMYDPMRIAEKGKKEKVLDKHTVIGFDVNGKTFRVKYNEKNDCVSIDCMNSTVYIQPVTTAQFLIK